MSSAPTKLTNNELNNRYVRRYQLFRGIVDGLMKQPGVSREVLEYAETLSAESVPNHNGYSRTWSQISKGNRQSATDGALEEFIEPMDLLYDKAVDLKRQAQQEQAITAEAVELASDDTDAFREARDFHRERSTWLLWGTIVTSMLSVGLVAWMFGFLGADGSLFDERAFSSESWPSLLAFLVGRAALLGILGWIMGHMARMQRAHASQAVLYQDRLSGLRAADLILRRGALEDRRAVVERLAESYLNLETNSFRQQPPTRAPPSVNVDDVERFAAAMSKVIGAMPGGA
jgi:hypothetical protein